jgi:hypothetical protein
LRCLLTAESCLLPAGFLLGLIFDPEDGGKILPEVLVDFHQNTQHYIPEDRALS